ncbi:MAG: hypothetical protein U0R51_03585 [Solirubrobacterales bacterium]
MGREKRVLTFAAAILAAAGALAAPASASPRIAAPIEVTITGSSIADYAFSPKRLEIRKGSTVHWSWNGGLHNVTFKAPGPTFPTTTTGDYERRFRKVGKYRYACTIHGFTGKVVVVKKH